jgi:hypothetical protein
MSDDLDSCPNCGAPGNRSAATRALMAGQGLTSACASCHGQAPGSRYEQFRAGLAHARVLDPDDDAELMGGLTMGEDYRNSRADYA